MKDEPLLWNALANGAWYLLPFGRLALLTGMREGELLNLRTSDIDFGRRLLYVREPKWKKDERRTEGLPLSAEALGILRELCQKARDVRLFWKESDGRTPGVCTVSRLFSYHARRAWLAGLHPHSLRHHLWRSLG